MEKLNNENIEKIDGHEFSKSAGDFLRESGLDSEYLRKHYQEIRQYFSQKFGKQYWISDKKVMEKYFEGMIIVKALEEIKIAREWAEEILPYISDKQFREEFAAPDSRISRQQTIEHQKQSASDIQKDIRLSVNFFYLMDLNIDFDEVVEAVKNIPTIQEQTNNFKINHITWDKNLHGFDKFWLSKKREDEEGVYKEEGEFLEYFRRLARRQKENMV